MAATDDMKAAFARDGALLLRLLWDEAAGPGPERVVVVFLADDKHLVYTYGAGADERIHSAHIDHIDQDEDGEEWRVWQKPYSPGHGGPVLVFSPIWHSSHSEVAERWKHDPARQLVEGGAAEVFGYAL